MELQSAFDYMVVLSDVEFAELMDNFGGRTAYLDLLKRKTTLIQNQKTFCCIEMPRIEMCLILNMIEYFGHSKMKQIFRDQLHRQDSEFLNYYDVLKRDLNRMH